MTITQTDIIRFRALLERNCDGSFLTKEEAHDLISYADEYIRLLDMKRVVENA